uniref:ORF1a polyprotein n=1 Tax=croton golden spot associated virus A TaxID=3072821 RepID=A0AA51N0U2_9CLOS|nr:ORF1a polyprotein [croton golden spot associated virus A]
MSLKWERRQRGSVIFPRKNRDTVDRRKRSRKERRKKREHLMRKIKKSKEIFSRMDHLLTMRGGYIQSSGEIVRQLTAGRRRLTFRREMVRFKVPPKIKSFQPALNMYFADRMFHNDLVNKKADVVFSSNGDFHLFLGSELYYTGNLIFHQYVAAYHEKYDVPVWLTVTAEGAHVLGPVGMVATYPELCELDVRGGKTSFDFMDVWWPRGGCLIAARVGFCWADNYIAAGLKLSEMSNDPFIEWREFHSFAPNAHVDFVEGALHVVTEDTPVVDYGDLLVGAGVGEFQEVLESSDLSAFSDVRGEDFLSKTLDTFLKRTAPDSKSNLVCAVDRVLTNAFEASVSKVDRGRFTIPVYLDSDGKDTLEKWFRIRNFNYGDGLPGGHGVLNASRSVINQMFHKQLRGVRYSDIGGDLGWHMRQGHLNVHVCAPILEARDGHRAGKIVCNTLSACVDEANKSAKLSPMCVGVNARDVCRKVVGECDHKTFAVTMVDVYDVSLRDFVNMMELKGSFIGRVALMFPPELLSRSGFVSHPDVQLTVLRTGDQLVFSVGDCGETYVHDLRILRDWFTSRTVVSRRGLTYAIELQEQYGPYTIFSVSLAPRADKVGTVERFMRNWCAGNTEVTLITTDGFSRHLVRLNLDSNFVNRMLLYLGNTCTVVEDRTVEYALSALRSHKTMVVAGSKIIHSKVDLDNSTCIELAVALLREAVMRRNRSRLAYRGGMYYWRKLMRFMSRSWRWLFSYVMSWFGQISSDDQLEICDLLSGEKSHVRDLEVYTRVSLHEEIGQEFDFSDSLDELLTLSGKLLLPRDKGGLKGGAKISLFDKMVSKEDEQNLQGLLKMCRRFTDLLTGVLKRFNLWRVFSPVLSVLRVMILLPCKFIKVERPKTNLEKLQEGLELMRGQLCEILRRCFSSTVRTVSDVVKDQWKVHGAGLRHRCFFLFKAVGFKCDPSWEIKSRTQICLEKIAVSVSKVFPPLAIGVPLTFFTYRIFKMLWFNESVRELCFKGWAKCMALLEDRPDMVVRSWAGVILGLVMNCSSFAAAVGFYDSVDAKTLAIGTLLRGLPHTKWKTVMMLKLMLCCKFAMDVPWFSRSSKGKKSFDLPLKGKEVVNYPDMDRQDFEREILTNLRQSAWSSLTAVQQEKVVKHLDQLVLDKALCDSKALGNVEGRLVDVKTSETIEPLPPALPIVSSPYVPRQVESEGPPNDVGNLNFGGRAEQLFDFLSMTKEEEKLYLSEMREEDRVGEVNIQNGESSRTKSIVEELRELSPRGHVLVKAGLTCDLQGLPWDKSKQLRHREALFFSRDPKMVYGHDVVTYETLPWLPELDLDDFTKGFNTVLVQRYSQGGRLNFHADDEPVYDMDDNVVVTVNLNGKATFIVRHNFSEVEESVELESGDCFIMGKHFQNFYKHSVVNCEMGRVSMTFRNQRRSILELRGLEEEKEVDVEEIIRQPPRTQNDTVNGTPNDEVSGETTLSSEVVQGSEYMNRVIAVTGMLCLGSPLWFNGLMTTSFYPRRVRLDAFYAPMAEYLLGEVRQLLDMRDSLKAVRKAGFLKTERGKRALVSSNKKEYAAATVLKTLDEYEETFKEGDRDKVLMVNMRTGYVHYKADKIFSLGDDVVYFADATPCFPLLKIMGVRLALSLVRETEMRCEKVVAINAVPGGGKTHELIQLVKSAPTNFVVCTANAATRDDIREALSSLEEEYDRNSIRTADGILVHADEMMKYRQRTLLVDECYMLHLGQLLLIVDLLRPKEVRLYGDRRQIPYINRVTNFIVSNGQVSSLQSSYEERLITYRCPADICWWLSETKVGGEKLYSDKVMTRSKVSPLKSVGINVVNCPDYRNLEKANAYLTFTQDEKKDMIVGLVRAGRKEDVLNVMTVHEAQGKTFPKVVIVRSKNVDDDVFDSLPHRLVALSRHTESLLYYVAARKQSRGIGGDIQKIMKLEEVALRHFVVEQCS